MKTLYKSVSAEDVKFIFKGPESGGDSLKNESSTPNCFPQVPGIEEKKGEVGKQTIDEMKGCFPPPSEKPGKEGPDKPVEKPETDKEKPEDKIEGVVEVKKETLVGKIGAIRNLFIPEGAEIHRPDFEKALDELMAQLNKPNTILGTEKSTQKLDLKDGTNLVLVKDVRDMFKDVIGADKETMDKVISILLEKPEQKREQLDKKSTDEIHGILDDLKPSEVTKLINMINEVVGLQPEDVVFETAGARMSKKLINQGVGAPAVMVHRLKKGVKTNLKLNETELKTLKEDPQKFRETIIARELDAAGLSQDTIDLIMKRVPKVEKKVTKPQVKPPHNPDKLTNPKEQPEDKVEGVTSIKFTKKIHDKIVDLLHTAHFGAKEIFSVALKEKADKLQKLLSKTNTVIMKAEELKKVDLMPPVNPVSFEQIREIFKDEKPETVDAIISVLLEKPKEDKDVLTGNVNLEDVIDVKKSSANPPMPKLKISAKNVVLLEEAKKAGLSFEYIGSKSLMLNVMKGGKKLGRVSTWVKNWEENLVKIIQKETVEKPKESKETKELNIDALLAPNAIIEGSFSKAELKMLKTAGKIESFEVSKAGFGLLKIKEEEKTKASFWKGGAIPGEYLVREIPLRGKNKKKYEITPNFSYNTLPVEPEDIRKPRLMN